MRWKNIWFSGLMGLVLMNGPVTNARAQHTAPPLEPDPMQIVRQVCDYLNSLKAFSYQAEVYDDQVFVDGKKLQYAIDMETFVRRPDRLRVDADGDLVNKQFFYNGRTITLYDKNSEVYGTMDVPPDIESALDKASNDFGLRVALTDLASPVMWDHVSKQITHSLYVGTSRIRGVPCHHLAIDYPDIHIQLWVATGDKPLVQKVLFLQKKLNSSPQWTAFIRQWNTSPQLGDDLFNFTAPAGVQLIKFTPVKNAAAPDKKGGKS